MSTEQPGAPLVGPDRAARRGQDHRRARVLADPAGRRLRATPTRTSRPTAGKPVARRSSSTTARRPSARSERAAVAARRWPAPTGRARRSAAARCSTRTTPAAAGRAAGRLPGGGLRRDRARRVGLDRPAPAADPATRAAACSRCWTQRASRCTSSWPTLTVATDRARSPKEIAAEIAALARRQPGRRARDRTRIPVGGRAALRGRGRHTASLRRAPSTLIGPARSRGRRGACAGATKVAVVHRRSVGDIAWPACRARTSRCAGHVAEVPDGEAAKTGQRGRGLVVPAGEPASPAGTHRRRRRRSHHRPGRLRRGQLAARRPRGAGADHAAGMVDAAVGGKTGINIPEGKNLVGRVPPAGRRAGRPGHAGDPAARRLRRRPGRGDQVRLHRRPGHPRPDRGRPGGAAARHGGARRARADRAGHPVSRPPWSRRTCARPGCGRSSTTATRSGTRSSAPRTTGGGTATRSPSAWSTRPRSGGWPGGSTSATARSAPRVLAAVGLPVRYQADAWPDAARGDGRGQEGARRPLRFVVLDGLARPGDLRRPRPRNCWSRPTRRCAGDVRPVRGGGPETGARCWPARPGLPFADADAVIEGPDRGPAELIFAEQGEAAFRALEQETIASLAGRAPAGAGPGAGERPDHEQTRPRASRRPTTRHDLSAGPATRAALDRVGGDFTARPDAEPPCPARNSPGPSCTVLRRSRRHTHRPAPDGRPPEHVCAEIAQRLAGAPAARQPLGSQ